MNMKRLLVIGGGVVVFGCMCLMGISLLSSTFPGIERVTYLATATSLPAQAVVVATNTLVPAPVATDTSIPTPIPTYTPTHTPEPTATPSPPTATPEPISLVGTGDSVVNVDLDGGPRLVHITGNASARYFSVVSLDENNQEIDLLANETSAYDGIKPLDWFESEHTHRFEVKASGDWTITIYPLSEAKTLAVPGQLSGHGDDVIMLTGAPRDIAVINGNGDARYFSVTSWGPNGIDLLVNTTDAYQGQVVLDREALYLEVAASGPWTIQVDSQ